MDTLVEAKRAWQPEPWSFREGWHKVRGALERLYASHPIATVAVAAIVVALIYSERAHYQGVFLFVRIYSVAVVATGLSLWGLWWVFARWNATHRKKAAMGALMALVSLYIAFFGKSSHEYVSQYYRYMTLTIVDLTSEPTTDHERLLPLHGVHVLARDRMNETESPSEPDLAKIGDKYRWTMAIEPASMWGRFAYDIHEFLNIAADEASPDFSRRYPERVHFSVGENLLFSRNVSTCTRLNFGLWRSFSYEPGNIVRLKDDQGKWVMAVLLVKWTGWVFPRPEPGGVQIIEQGSTNTLGRHLWGCGRWIPQDDIKNHKFLVGQNLVPFEVSRYMAESLRFQAGFLGPLQISRTGDLRIADMPDDVNQQPFTLFFRMPKGEEKLYQYFGLEPRDKDKQGLSTSFFIPADGIGTTYAIKHYDRRIPIGITAVADQVRASRKNYDWSHNAVVEVRPYVHPIADAKGVIAPRFAWMVTVVTVKDRRPGAPVQFTTGGDPEIALVDAYWNKVVWVDSQKPERWPEQLKAELAERWAN